MSVTKSNGYRRRTKTAPRRIISTRIMIQWNDNPKEQVSYHDMPSHIADAYDEWLALVEDEENAKNGL